MLRLGREPGDGLAFDEWLVGRWINEVGEECGTMTDRSHDTTVRPYLRRDVLQARGSGIVDQRCMTCRSVEQTVLRPIELRGLGHIVELLAEDAVGVVPSRQGFSVQEVGLLGKPVGCVFARLRGEVDFEACFCEDLVWVQGFADEETSSFFALEQGGAGGGDADEGTTRWRHFV